MSVVDLAWHSLVSTSGCPTSGATRISTSAAHRHPASPPRHPCFTSLCRCHRTAPTSAGTPSPAGHNCGGTLAGGAALAVLGGWAAAVAAVLAGGPPRRLCAAGPGAPPRPALPPLVCACMTPLSSPDMPHCTNSSSSSSWRLGQGPLQPRLPGSPCSPVVPHPDAGAGWCGGPHAPAGGPVPTGGTGGGGGGARLARPPECESGGQPLSSARATVAGCRAAWTVPIPHPTGISCLQAAKQVQPVLSQAAVLCATHSLHNQGAWPQAPRHAVHSSALQAIAELQEALEAREGDKKKARPGLDRRPQRQRGHSTFGSTGPRGLPPCAAQPCPPACACMHCCAPAWYHRPRPPPALAHPQVLRSLKKTRLEVEMLAEQLAQVGAEGR